LRGFERDGRLFTALRADRFRFHALDAGRRRFATLRTNRLTSLAPLGFVFETFVREKHLLAGGENEFSPALGALQNLVMVFHKLLRGPCSHRASSLQNATGEGWNLANARDPHHPCAGIELLWLFRVWLA
jgi:hypothetical protein